MDRIPLLPLLGRDVGLFLVRVWREGLLGCVLEQLGSMSILCFCNNTVETVCENGLPLQCETQVAVIDANVLPCS